MADIDILLALMEKHPEQTGKVLSEALRKLGVQAYLHIRKDNNPVATPVEMIKDGQRQTLYSEAKVSLALADGWQRVSDLSPAKQAELRDRPPLPWSGYDDMTAHEVLAQVNGLPPDRVKEVITYESATKGRVSIIGKLTGTSTTFMQGMPRRAVTEEQPPQTIETVIERPLQTTETVEIVDGGKGE